MRKPRLKAPSDHPIAYYHCVSRVVDRQFKFGPEEKDLFLSLMKEYSRFCGVRVTSYCIMSNHFHLAVEVPKQPENLTGYDWLLERLDALTVSYPVASNTRKTILKFVNEGAHEQWQELIEKYKALMWDISSFMKLLKQRFTMRYNKTHDRKGTLWESRFKSTLVEGPGGALAAISAYIDLNPVRAGIVEDPADYAWSSYGKASQGDARAIEGIRTVVAGAQRVDESSIAIDEGMKAYRELLIGKSATDAKLSNAPEMTVQQLPKWKEGAIDKVETTISCTATPVPLGPTKEEILGKIMSKQPVSLAEYVRIRVRYFTDGGALGSMEFVDAIFQGIRNRFGIKKKTSSYRVSGLDSMDMYSLRNFAKRPFG